MKMLIKFLVALGLCWLMGVVFFCIIPPLVVPVCAFFWPMWVLPLWAAAALVFAIVVMVWQSLYWCDNIRVSKEQYELATTLPMGVVELKRLGVFTLEDAKKTINAASTVEHMYVSGDWIDGYSLIVYYDDFSELKKGHKAAEKFRKDHKKN